MGEEEKKNADGTQTLNPPEEGKLNPQVTPSTDEDEDDAELLAFKDQVKKKLEDKKSDDDIAYSKKDVDRMMKEMEKKFSQKKDIDEEDFIDLLDPNAVKRKFVRLSRLNNKFIVGLKNLNEDSYNDEPIYLKNVEHPTKKGEYVPWAMFIYEDGSEELYPYLSFMNRGRGVWAEVVDEKKEDVSKTFGLIDVKTVEDDEWNMKNTGKKILAKALQFKTTYICKEIKTGKTMAVSEDVINKVEAPYLELRKFLENK